MVNVLQAIILTEDEKMVLTPTYHVFDMYKVHQDATRLPISVSSYDYTKGRRSLKAISATASKNEKGEIHISLVNVDPVNEIEFTCDLRGTNASKIAFAQVLTAKEVGSHNTFAEPEVVKITDLKGAKIEKGILKVKLPAKSLVTVGCSAALR